MVRFPPAKINLGLNVVRKRPDGYHDIESVMMAIPLFDMLEVVLADDTMDEPIEFTRSGLEIPGDPLKDLCLLAVEQVRQHVDLPPLRVHLHKVIPTGAGLGGGSSDAAHMLMMLTDLFAPHLKGKLPSMAATLGSDVPFFLDPRPQFAEGRGERLRPIDLHLKDHWLVLVNPGVHIPTAEVYKATKPSGVSVDLPEILEHGPIGSWQSLVRNAMEAYVLDAYPAVADVKARLIQAGSSYCAMSGSGSTVFGIFNERPPFLEWPTGHRAWTFQLP